MYSSTTCIFANLSLQRESFQGERTRGKVVPVFTAFQNAKNALNCRSTFACIESQKFFRNDLYCVGWVVKLYSPGLIPPDHRERSRCLDPDTNFRSAFQRSHCSRYTKRPLLVRPMTQLNSTQPAGQPNPRTPLARSGGSKNFEKGVEDNLSALSSFIANAHNDL